MQINMTTPTTGPTNSTIPTPPPTTVANIAGATNSVAWIRTSRAGSPERSSRPVSVETPGERRRWRNVGLATAIAATAVGTILVAAMGDDFGPAAPATVATAPAGPDVIGRDAVLRDLVNRGLVPHQALDPAPVGSG